MKKKKYITLFFALVCVLGLFGCAGKPHGTTNTHKTERTTTEEDFPKIISSDMLSQEIYDTLQNEWDAFGALSTEQKMLSSHIPGVCQKDFDSWAECEDFIGFSIPNPLESHSDLENGTYVGMPTGFMDAPHVRVNWYGTQDGHVEWISVQSGYRNDQLRIVVDAKLYGDPSEEKSSDSGWSIDLERLEYLANTDGASPVVTEDSGERYVASTAYMAKGYVLYSVRVIGEPDMQDEVQNTLIELLTHFQN